jgi:predicted MPP superfamily phosphohydrolase
MPQWASFAVFFLIVLSVYGGAHYYLYTWFIRLTDPSRFWRWGMRLIFILLVVSFPLARILARYDFNAFNYSLTLISSVWMGFSLYFFLLCLGSDLGLTFFRIMHFSPKVSIQRSLSYRRVLVACIAAAVVGIGGIALQEACNLGVTRLDVPLRGLPPDMDGFSLVQVSDVHYGMLTENGRLSKIVDRVNDLQPDVVVITGDLVDEGVSHMEEMAIPLSRLRARHGVFAVTGNHEYYAGVDRAVSIMRAAGIKVLRNEVQVVWGRLQILGIDDPTGSRRLGNPTPDFEKLFSHLTPNGPSILLYHQPIHFEKASSSGVNLQLSGHTHGGQLFPIRYISRMIYPFTPGLHQIGASHLYVSRGVGTWGPPMRLMSPPELVYIRLRSPRSPT